jgi:hypothetical protein
MQPDTRKILTSGIAILGTGLLCVAAIFFLFGGVSRTGPHNNGGWLALVVAMGCLPTGSLTLLLGLLKLFGDLRR